MAWNAQHVCHECTQFTSIGYSGQVQITQLEWKISEKHPACKLESCGTLEFGLNPTLGLKQYSLIK